MATETADVAAAIEREFAAFAGTGGLLAKNLGAGEEIRVNADGETAMASTIEVPILIELFRRVEAGEFDLEDRLPASAEAQAPGSGILRELTVGVELSIRDHATLMIAVSDNTSTNVLIDLLGIEAINRTMAEFGFPRTRLVNRLDFPVIGPDARNLAVTTPADLAWIMEALATGAILTDASRDAILDIMRRQHSLDMVPRYPLRRRTRRAGQRAADRQQDRRLDGDARRHGPRRMAGHALRRRRRHRGRPRHPVLGREHGREARRPRFPPRVRPFRRRGAGGRRRAGRAGAGARRIAAERNVRRRRRVPGSASNAGRAGGHGSAS